MYIFIPTKIGILCMCNSLNGGFKHLFLISCTMQHGSHGPTRAGSMARFQPKVPNNVAKLEWIPLHVLFRPKFQGALDFWCSWFNPWNGIESMTWSPTNSIFEVCVFGHVRLVWSLFLIWHLYLEGIWEGFVLLKSCVSYTMR